jgi:hypothetical protein
MKLKIMGIAIEKNIKITEKFSARENTSPILGAIKCTIILEITINITG